MSDRIAQTHRNLVRNYIRAKDENRPHLMDKVFADSAILNMELKTKNIAFPSEVIGRDAITDVLVRRFSSSYENVYTYCLSDSLDDTSQQLFCKWLVIMSDKEDGSVRIGCGQYHWCFTGDVSPSLDPLVNRLTITIDHMSVLPSETQSQFLGKQNHLSYPWCDKNSVLEFLPSLTPLRPVRDFFNL